MKEIKEDCSKRLEKKNAKTAKKRVFSSVKKPPIKKKQKLYSTNDSDLECFSTVLSTGSSELTDIETKITEDLADESFANGIVAKDDFILVKFFTKKSHKYYVGQVRDIEQNGDYPVNFMRRTQPGYHFVFPVVEDVSMVPADDAVKLPHPCSVGGTARVNRKLSFPINFTKFDNVD
ncbi:hypothetical protein JTB14_036666 [Gonioctena quinquepunctata]|nr:hypothetical protein JTB14_036666 [Gonioctena quinquepunctata]